MKSIRNLVEGKEYITVQESDPVRHAAEVMAKNDIGAVPVLSHSTGELVGIISERDLLKRVIVTGLSLDATTIGEVMTTELLSTDIDESTEVCMAIMKHNRVRHLVVTKSGTCMGMLSMRDLMHAEVNEKLEQIEALQEYITGKPLIRDRK